jgi:hypothetical protein
MVQVSKDQFFAKYIRPSNFDELINADILIMPLYFGESQRTIFSLDQDIFKELQSEYNGTLLFYADTQNPVFRLTESFIPPDIDFGTIISTISGLITIYHFLKEKLSNKERSNKRFTIKHGIKINDNSIEITSEFQGTIEQYDLVINELIKELEISNKK